MALWGTWQAPQGPDSEGSCCLTFFSRDSVSRKSRLELISGFRLSWQLTHNAELLFAVTMIFLSWAPCTLWQVVNDISLDTDGGKLLLQQRGHTALVSDEIKGVGAIEPW